MGVVVHPSNKKLVRSAADKGQGTADRQHFLLDTKDDWQNQKKKISNNGSRRWEQIRKKTLSLRNKDQ